MRSGIHTGVLLILALLLPGCPPEAPASRPVRRHSRPVPEAPARLAVRALADAERSALVEEKVAAAESALRHQSLSDAIRTLHKVLALEPGHARALAMLDPASRQVAFLARVRAFYLAEDFGARLSLLYREGEALDPALRDRCLFAGWFDLAVVHARAGRFAEAAACLDEAAALRRGEAGAAGLRAVVRSCETRSPARCFAADAIDFRWP